MSSKVIAYAVSVIITLAIFALSVFLTKVVWESDIPTWLKVFLTK